MVGGKDIAGKECALITCCEEEDMTVMDGVRIPLERTAALNKWKMVGEVLVPGVLNAGDIAKTDGCAQAAALADKIYEAESITKKIFMLNGRPHRILTTAANRSMGAVRHRMPLV